MTVAVVLATICGRATPTAAHSALLMSDADAEVAKLVNGIKALPAWRRHGRNAIVLIWDESDYSNAANRVVLLVQTNYAPNAVHSGVPYDHDSLLRTLEAGLGLPCLRALSRTRDSNRAKLAR